jgi:hypothetical protein
MSRNKKSILPQKKSVFSFVVDGECEYWYLQMLKHNEKSLKIHLSPNIYKKKTLEEQYKRVIELAKESEKVFWVVDFDVINKETKERKHGQKSKLTKFKECYQKVKRHSNIEIIVNNPCLEYWFLLHFEQTTKYFEGYDKLEMFLKKHLSNYQKTEKYFVKSNPDIYKRLKPNLSTAISNSQTIGEFDFDNVQTGITEMYKIFRELSQKRE